MIGGYFMPLNWKDSTTLRPKKTRSATIGIAPRTVQAIKPVQSGTPDWCCVRNALIATAITRTDSARPIRNGQKNSLHLDTVDTMASLASEGPWIGTFHGQKIEKYDAPSTRAASHSTL